MKVTVDTERRVIEVNGIRYSFELFNHFTEPGTLLRVEENENGLITTSKLGMDHIWQELQRVRRENANKISETKG